MAEYGYEPPMEKKILDVTCGGRSIWFNKCHPAAIYCDKRVSHDTAIWKSGDGLSERKISVEPDVQCDFTSLPFNDNSFSLVVFDPPHLLQAGETAWLVKKYGHLDKNWPKMLHDGFAECMRVLKPDGVLIFKWSEYDIPAEKVWKAIGEKPLFGHHSGRQSKTFWGCFMKLKYPAQHWLRREQYLNEYWKCSSCGEDFVFEDGTPLSNGYRFCPYCGMRISDEVNDDDETDI